MSARVTLISYQLNVSWLINFACAFDCHTNPVIGVFDVASMNAFHVFGGELHSETYTTILKGDWAYIKDFSPVEKITRLTLMSSNILHLWTHTRWKGTGWR